MCVCACVCVWGGGGGGQYWGGGGGGGGGQYWTMLLSTLLKKTITRKVENCNNVDICELAATMAEYLQPCSNNSYRIIATTLVDRTSTAQRQKVWQQLQHRQIGHKLYQ